jgi:hypothetical protein
VVSPRRSHLTQPPPPPSLSSDVEDAPVEPHTAQGVDALALTIALSLLLLLLLAVLLATSC